TTAQRSPDAGGPGTRPGTGGPEMVTDVSGPPYARRMTTNEPPVGPDPQEPQEPQGPAAPPPSPPGWGGSTYPPPPGDPGGGGGWGGDSGSGGYPPPPPPGGDSGFVPPFSAADAIGYGWTKFTQNLGQWLLAGLAIVVVSLVFGGLSWAVQPSISANET